MKINKNIGAKVIVKMVLVEISPKVKWRYLKKVSGIIVERGEHEHYYHTSTGGYTHATKHLIHNDAYENYAIKLDDKITDIEGNNIIVVRESNLKFLDRILPVKKLITETQYLNAKKIIKEYESQIS